MISEGYLKQYESEEIIKLSFDNGDGHPQQVIIHQQPVISTDSALHKASVHAMFNTGPQYNGANSGQVTPPQPATNTPAKKRTRKSKDKQSTKLNKTTMKSNLSMEFGPNNELHQPPHFLSPNSMQSHNPTGNQFPQTNSQLSPSVEHFVSEAWEQQMQQQMHNQSAEADIMDVQLQSLLSSSATSVSTAVTNIMHSNEPSSFPQQPHQQFNVGGIIQNTGSFGGAPHMNAMQNADNQTTPSPKHQNTTVNFPQNPLAPTSNKLFNPQAIVHQGINTHIINESNQYSTSIPSAGNSDGDFMRSSSSNNGKMNNLGFQNSEIPSHVNPANQHVNLTSNSTTNWQYGNMLSSSTSYKTAMSTATVQSLQVHGDVNQSITPQQIVQSPSPAIQPPFPFSFSNQASNKQETMEELRSDKGLNNQGMSMASPLLVTLLQTEACSTGMASIQSSAHTTMAGESQQKPKRKKPTRKKKPKSSAPTTPTDSVIQASGCVFTTQDQVVNMPAMDGQLPYLNQRFQQYKVQPQEHMLHHNLPASMLHAVVPENKQNFHDPKISVIETISRSDVGARSMSFPGNMPLSHSHEAIPRGQAQGMPMFQRQDSARMPVPQPYSASFDPSKSQFQQKPMINMNPQQQSQQQQQLFNMQMGTNQFHPFDSNLGNRGVMQQHQPQQVMQHRGQMPGAKSTGQYLMGINSGTFPPGMPDASMVPQNIGMQFNTQMSIQNQMQSQSFIKKQQLHSNVNNNNNNINFYNDYPQISQLGGPKKHQTLPTLPQAPHMQPSHHQMPQNILLKNSRVSLRQRFGHLTNGSLSIIMKGSCCSPESGKASTIHLPTLPQSTISQSISQSISQTGRISQQRKSPGSESQSFSSPSRKGANHRSTSPHSSMMGSSPLSATHGSRSGTPKSRSQCTTPRSMILSNTRNSISQPRRPSLDQYSVQSPINHPHNFPSAPTTPTNRTHCNSVQNFFHQQTSGNFHTTKLENQVVHMQENQPQLANLPKTAYWNQYNYNTVSHNPTPVPGHWQNQQNVPPYTGNHLMTNINTVGLPPQTPTTLQSTTTQQAPMGQQLFVPESTLGVASSAVSTACYLSPQPHTGAPANMSSSTTVTSVSNLDFQNEVPHCRIQPLNP